MSTLRRLGYHRDSERVVYMLTIEVLSESFTLREFAGQQFTCFCALDTEGVPANEIGTLCSRLLELGCAYLCAWGADCERVHDIMDETVVGDNPPESYKGCVMTTWHEESLERSLWYFLECTVTDKKCAPNGCGTAVIISRSRNAWNADIEKNVLASIGVK